MSFRCLGFDAVFGLSQRRACVSLLSLTLMTFVAIDAAAQVAGPDAPSFVAFNSQYHDELKHVYLFDFATQSVKAINPDDVFEQQEPTISAGGRWIAFQAFGPPHFDSQDIFLFDRASGDVVPLPGLNSDFDEREPSITGGGRFIAFSSDRTGNFDIYLYDRQTSSLVPLPNLNGGFNERNPSIGSSAQLIAFESDRAQLGNVYVYDRTTSSLLPTPGLNGGSLDSNPALSGDGHFLAFESYRSGGGDVYLYDLTLATQVAVPGLNKKRLGYASFDGQPSLNKNGRFIAFSSLRNDAGDGDCELGDCHDWDIFVYDRDTSTTTQLPIPDFSTVGEVNPSLR